MRIEAVTALYEERIPSRILSSQKENGLHRLTVGHGDGLAGWYVFREISHPPLVIVPGMGCSEQRKQFILRKFSFLLRKGHPLIFYNLAPDFPEHNEAFFLFIRKAVVEIRGLLDLWTREFGRRIRGNGAGFHCTGMSAGGIAGTILAAVDDRVERLLLLIAGGNFEAIKWKGILRCRMKKDCPHRACRQMYQAYRKLLDMGCYEELFNFPVKCFLFDPLTFAGSLVKKQVLMINGVFDLIIPFFSALELRTRLGNPPILWYPGTHLSLSFFFRFFERRITAFLEN